MASKFFSFFNDIFGGITDMVSDIFGFGKNIGDAIDTAVNSKDHGFKFDNNGFASFSQSDWDLSTNGPDDEAMRYVNEWNTSLNQYNQQYSLQKDAFNFNKQLQSDAFDFNKFMAQQTFDYNKSLSERQQALSEESYRNGTINQAKQLAMLGINPASSGGTVTPMSMSGGSSLGNTSLNAGSLNAGSTSSTGVHSSVTNKKMLQLQMLNYLTQLRKTNSEIRVNESSAKVNESNARVNEYNAETSRMSAESNIDVNDSHIILNKSSVRQMDSVTEHNIALTARQVMDNDDYRNYLDSLKPFGVSDNMIRAFSNVDWQVAVACGLVRVLGKEVGVPVPNAPNVPASVSEAVKSINANKLRAIYGLDGESRSSLSSGITRFLSMYPNRADVVSDLTTSEIYYMRNKGYKADDVADFLSKMVKFSSGHVSNSGTIHGGSSRSF